MEKLYFTVIQEFVKKFWRYILVFILGFTLGHYMFPTTITKEIPSEPIVQTKVEYKDRTIIQYVEKQSPNDSDVEITKEQPKVSVSVNNKKYNFDLVQGEEQKFDKGKLVVDQSSTLDIDVTAEVQKQIENGIKKAFADQKKKPQYRMGLTGDTDKDLNFRISRQSKNYDVDLKINTDKKIKAEATLWFK